jgi:hypothetical protein
MAISAFSARCSCVRATPASRIVAASVGSSTLASVSALGFTTRTF